MAFFAHIGTGFALKPAAPKAPVILLITAAMSADLVCFLLMALGVAGESILAWTHGLFISGVWALVFGFDPEKRAGRSIYRNRGVRPLVDRFHHSSDVRRRYEARYPAFPRGFAESGTGAVRQSRGGDYHRSRRPRRGNRPLCSLPFESGKASGYITG